MTLRKSQAQLNQEVNDDSDSDSDADSDQFNIMTGYKQQKHQSLEFNFDWSIPTSTATNQILFKINEIK